MPRRGQIRGFDLGTDLNIILLVGGGVMVYFLGKNIGLWGGSSSGSLIDKILPSNKTSATGAVNMATQQMQKASNQGNGPNYTADEYNAWAATILQVGNVTFPSSDPDGKVLSIMDQMDNDADVYALISAFGTPAAGILRINYDLDLFIMDGFTSGAIAAFNQQLLYNPGVTFQWQ